MSVRRFAMRVPSVVRALVVAAGVLVGGGCGKEPAPAPSFSGITAGMTIEEADKLVGLGEEVRFDALPPLYRTILEKPAGGTPPVKGPDVVYRKWTRKIGQTGATSYAAFRDGRVVDGTVFVETVRSGQ